MSRVFGKYLVLQVPGWCVAALVLWTFHTWGDVPAGIAAALFGAWVLKDLLLFPAMRRFYVSEPADRRVLRQHGTAVTPLAPDGFVRVHGELWQARSDRKVEQGARVRVREVRGMLLLVSPD